MKTILFMLTLAGTSLPAWSHYLWIEPGQSTQAKLYFGEWHNNETETEDGRLARIQATEFAPAERVTSVTRQHDHIAITLKQAGSFAVTERMPPRTKKNSTEATRTILLARTGRTHSKPLLELDLTASKQSPQTFTLTYKGKALAKTRVVVMAPNRWQKSFKTDQNGQIRIQTPWKGFYLLKVKHLDNQPGSVDQTPYDKTEYNLTLTFQNEQGRTWHSED